MHNIDISRLIRLMIAGAIAGLIVFLILNPAVVRDEQARDPMQALQTAKEMGSKALSDSCLMGLVLGVFTGGMLVLADEFGLLLKRLALKLSVALLAGVVVGGICGIIAQMFFSFMLSMGGILLLLPARVFGWGILGIGAGAGIGLATGSMKRVMICILGGFIGGLAGGAMFDVTGLVTGGGSVSRFIGFVLMCAAVGAAVAWVEERAKQSWVTILTGMREGKSYILTKQLTTLGRDELADIPLFGDSSVAKQHAALRMAGHTITLQCAPGTSAAVNGAPAAATQLKDSDVISIGRHALRFHQKATQAVGAMQTHLSYPGPSYPPSPYPAQPSPYGSPQQIALQATGRLSLTAVAGPHAGQSFSFGPGLVKIGREADCQICLPQDTMISRNHAEIGWDGANWHIRDMGSRNGLFINGMRISQQMLNGNDQVTTGQTTMRVDGL